MQNKYQMKVYRYLSFRRFSELLFMKELALINPAKWPDQYEMYTVLELFDSGNQERYQMLFDDYEIPFEKNFDMLRETVEAVLNDSYCLCFSRSKDSEVMWNAYSYQNNARMIRTSVDKLLALAPESLSVARVRYDLKSTQLDFLLENCEFEAGGLTIHHSDELLRHKRKCFQYENELRLIGGSFDDSPHRMGDGIVYLPIADISNFVERVMVHPLADDGYVSLIEKICQHFGIQFWGRSKIYEFKRK